MTCWPAEVVRLPVQGVPSAPPPEALQEAALLTCQLRVNALPTMALAGAEIESVTSATTVTICGGALTITGWDPCAPQSKVSFEAPTLPDV
jgi:hypothetical protein